MVTETAGRCGGQPVRPGGSGREPGPAVPIKAQNGTTARASLRSAVQSSCRHGVQALTASNCRPVIEHLHLTEPRLAPGRPGGSGAVAEAAERGRATRDAEAAQQGPAFEPSGEAGQRVSAVVGDHVGESGHDVDWSAALGAVQFGVGPVQVAHDPLGVGPVGEAAEIGVARGLQRRHPGGPAAVGEGEDEPQVLAIASTGARSWKTGPWPGTVVVAPSGATTSCSTSIAPATEPMSRNGVPPLKTRSPQNSVERSGNHTSESLVVCAGVPTWRTSARRSPTWSVTPSVKVRNGGSSGSEPQSGFCQKGSARGGPKAIISSRARSCATIVAVLNRPLPQ